MYRSCKIRWYNAWGTTILCTGLADTYAASYWASLLPWSHHLYLRFFLLQLLRGVSMASSAVARLVEVRVDSMPWIVFLRLIWFPVFGYTEVLKQSTYSYSVGTEFRYNKVTTGVGKKKSLLRATRPPSWLFFSSTDLPHVYITWISKNIYFFSKVFFKRVSQTYVFHEGSVRCSAYP